MDTIGDMLTSIRNGYMTKKEVVALPYSKLKEAVAKKLAELSFVEKVEVEDVVGKKKLTVKLKYRDNKPALTHLKRVSKPGLRVYSQRKKLKPVLGGLGYTLISTPQGILTNKEAVKKGVGGELICEVW